MPLSTKQKIIESATDLFNEFGLASVRLQQIADEAGISVGNLAYHYKTKDIIIEEVYHRAFAEFNTLLSRFLQEPSLRDFDDQLTEYFRFFQGFGFCFTEIAELERTLPKLARQWNDFLQKLYLQIRNRLTFNERKGWLLPEPAPGTYDLVANNIWLTCTFWITKQNVLRRSSGLSAFKNAVWTQLKAYLSPEGQRECASITSPKWS